MGKDRDATPHECYVSTVARLVADGDASVVDFKDPMYQEWVRLRTHSRNRVLWLLAGPPGSAKRGAWAKLFF